MAEDQVAMTFIFLESPSWDRCEHECMHTRTYTFGTLI